MHCSWCVSYRVLQMTSHSRRTHLDIFCKLYFALGFLQKIPNNLAPSSHILSQQITLSSHSFRKTFHLVFTAVFLLLMLYITSGILIFHFIRQREQNSHIQPLRRSPRLVIVTQTQVCFAVAYKTLVKCERQGEGCSSFPTVLKCQ